jgi:hypothetical protein
VKVGEIEVEIVVDAAAVGTKVILKEPWRLKNLVSTCVCIDARQYYEQDPSVGEPLSG